MSDKAYTVIGTNVVIDCGTVEEAIAYERELWANQPYAPADAERARHAALVEAARLPRNVLIYDGQSSDYFKGEWVAVPRADFDVLRAALDRSEDK